VNPDFRKYATPMSYPFERSPLLDRRGNGSPPLTAALRPTA
jgi:hypothetical protein